VLLVSYPARQVERIDEVTFSSTGKLVAENIPRKSVDMEKWIGFNGTAIRRLYSKDSKNPKDDSHLETIVEIFKILGQQESSVKVGQCSSSRQTFTCGTYRSFHLGMLLHQEELTALVDMVGIL
jgi:hypothetical protein